MRFFLIFWAGVLVFFPALPQAVPSNVYSYTHLPIANYTGYEEKTLLEGTTRDFSHLIAQAILVGANQPAQPTQQIDEEAILIIKEGELTLTLGSKRKTLKPGSVVMIMPGDDYQIENKTAQPLTYYQIRYTSNEMPDLDLYQLVGGSLWIDWQEVALTTNQHGSSRQLATLPSVMSSRIVLQVTTINPGSKWFLPHTHRAAEILLPLDHPVQAQIGDVQKRANAGDIIFVESDVSHGISPSSPDGCTYLSIQF